MALFLKKNHIRPEQVQDFYPTPGTISTTMFYTGLDPYTMEEVYSAKLPHDKALQRALLQYYNPKNFALVEEALRKIHRFDLIGNGDNCLVREQNPRPKSNKYNSNQNYGKNNNRRRSGNGYQKSKKKR